MYDKLLTKQEEKVMELFWATNLPLTSKDVLLRINSADWSGAYVYRVLQTLEKKGLIRMCGQVRCKTQYMREYVASLSKEEFYVRLAYTNHVNREEFVKQAVLLAILEKADEKEDIQREILRFDLK